MSPKFQQTFLKIMKEMSSADVFGSGEGGESLTDPNTSTKFLMSVSSNNKKTKKNKKFPLIRRNLKGMPRL
jgi:hypothetical protein